MRQLGFIAGWVVLSVCAGCGTKPLGSPAGLQQTPGGGLEPVSGPVDPNADRQIELILAGKGEDDDKAVPADEFFAGLGQKYMIWKGEVEWFKKLADDAKAAGSPGVHAVVSTLQEGGVGVCAQYIIALPADAAARAKIIELYNNFWKRGLDELSEEERKVVEEDIASELAQDHGQKFLMLNYDP